MTTGARYVKVPLIGESPSYSGKKVEIVSRAHKVASHLLYTEPKRKHKYSPSRRSGPALRNEELETRTAAI